MLCLVTLIVGMLWGPSVAADERNEASSRALSEATRWACTASPSREGTGGEARVALDHVDTACERAFHAALEADVVLLGELHGHPDHHALQLRWLQAFAATGRLPVLAMEIFDFDDQPALDAAVRAVFESGLASRWDDGPQWRAPPSEAGAPADALADAVSMADRGWPWKHYRPLVDQALRSGWPIVAINLSADEARRVAVDGYDAVPRVAEWRETTTVLDTPWPDARVERWLDVAYDAHCAMVPREQLEGFLRAQRARDLGMALAIRRALEQARQAASSGGRPVVIATLGREHARRDYAVPAVLEALGMARTQVWALGMDEVSADGALAGGPTAPTDRGAETDQGPVGGPRFALPGENDAGDRRFDAVYWGQPIERPDPCAAFQRR